MANRWESTTPFGHSGHPGHPHAARGGAHRIEGPHHAPPNPYLVRSVQETSQVAPAPRPKVQGKSRLFLGSLPTVLKQEELQAIFERYGEILDLYHVPAKGFAFLKMATWEAATKILEDWDNKMLHGRAIRVKRASANSDVHVSELSPFVTNELLASAFTFFGAVDRAVVICDERGNSLCKGIVEFSRKQSVQKAIDRVQKPFVITKGGQPVRATKVDHEEDEQGLDNASLRRTPGSDLELSIPPHFTAPGTAEHDFGLKWVALYAQEEKEKEEMKKRQQEARAVLKRQSVEAFAQETRAKEQAAREQQFREQQMREQQAREQQMREQQSRELQAREQQMREQQMREQHQQMQQPTAHGQPQPLGGSNPYYQDYRRDQRDHQQGPPHQTAQHQAPPPPGYQNQPPAYQALYPPPHETPPPPPPRRGPAAYDHRGGPGPGHQYPQQQHPQHPQERFGSLPPRGAGPPPPPQRGMQTVRYLEGGLDSGPPSRRVRHY